MPIAPGNKTHVFPTPSPNSSEPREDEIISRTRHQMFHDHSITHHHATHGGGTRNSIAAMTYADGKENQEAYRVGLSRSKAGHDRVADR